MFLVLGVVGQKSQQVVFLLFVGLQVVGYHVDVSTLRTSRCDSLARMLRRTSLNHIFLVIALACRDWILFRSVYFFERVFHLECLLQRAGTCCSGRSSACLEQLRGVVPDAVDARHAGRLVPKARGFRSKD